MTKKYKVGLFIFSAVIFSGCQLNYQKESQFLESKDNQITDTCKIDTCSAEKSEEEIIESDNKKQVDFSLSQPVFNFSAEVSQDWEIELIPEIEAINIYNPNLIGSNNLEKSIIFIRYFKANDFLTLSTVNIYSKEEKTINDRPAVVYDIEKKSGINNFANQPLWRNQRHFVTDIRSTNNNPTTFYVFAKSPDLSQEIFDDFLSSVKISL